MTIAEQIRGLAEGHAAALPAEVMSAFAREQAELAVLEPVEVIAVGELLPDSDLLDAHGHATTLQTMPTVLILAPDLTVRWVDVRPDYTTRSEPAEILAALDAITR